MSGSALARWLAPLALAWCVALAGADRPGPAVAGGPGVAEVGPSSLEPGQALLGSSATGREAPGARVGSGAGVSGGRGRSAPVAVANRVLSSGPPARERRARHLDFWTGDALARAGIPCWRTTAPPRVRAA